MTEEESLAVSPLSVMIPDTFHHLQRAPSLGPYNSRLSSSPWLSVSAASSATSTETAPAPAPAAAFANQHPHEHVPHSPCSSPKPYASSPWDMETPSTSSAPYTCLASIVKRCGTILALAVSEAGLLYVGSESKSIRVWKLPGFIEFGHLRSGSPSVKAILVSEEEGMVLSAHSDNRIRIWGSSPDHTRKGTLPPVRDGFIQFTNLISRSREFFARSSSFKSDPSGTWNRRSSSTNVKHSSTITSLVYDPVGKLLYSASLDRTVKVWSIVDMKCVETIRAHDDCVNALALGPEGLLFSGSDDATVRIWRKSLHLGCYHGLLLSLSVRNTPVKALALSSEAGDDQSYILYGGCSDGYVHYWKKGDLSGHMNYCGYLRGHGHTVMCLAMAEDMVVSGSADTSIRVWRRSRDGLAMHRCVAVLSGHIAPVKGVAAKIVDAGGCLIYSGSLDGAVKLWWVWRGGCHTWGSLGGEERTPAWLDFFQISSSSG